MSHPFTQHIIRWYRVNKRDLPWRQTKDPYFVWLSEIILQQTQVNQGLPYYERFSTTYPNVLALANATEQEVLNLWQGLGYYSRARNLHHTAKVIANEMSGKFPTSYTELIALKGIGDYTASAIASICFNEVVPTIDGNVYRVLSRVFGIQTPINEHRAKAEFKSLAQSLIDPENPGTFNQAMMEFGALQCTPKNADCQVCVLNDVCYAFQHRQVYQLPVKTKKIKIKNRYFDYLIFKLPQEQTLLIKRESKDIWRHLYQFPLIESQSFPNRETLQEKTSSLLDVKQLILLNKQPIKHKLTHQLIHIRFWEVESDQQIDNSISWAAIDDYPLPIVIHRFLEQNL